MIPNSNLGTSRGTSGTQRPVTLVIEPDGSLHLGLSPDTIRNHIQADPEDVTFAQAAPRVLVSKSTSRRLPCTRTQGIPQHWALSCYVKLLLFLHWPHKR